jgi:hypothetical protein
MVATVCWLIYIAVVSSASPYGFGVVEFLLAIMLPAALYFVMFFLAPWIIKGISKNS